jgi:hypothetical protein
MPGVRDLVLLQYELSYYKLAFFSHKHLPSHLYTLTWRILFASQFTGWERSLLYGLLLTEGLN